MKKILLFFIIAICFNSFSQNTCNNALAFCDSVVFPSVVNGPTVPPAGPNFGCLATQPNCSWFYTQVTVAGNIDIELSAANDIDFICWGPFNTLVNACSNLTGTNTIDCSYSALPTETLNIPNAVVGEYYIFVTTNFANTTNPILIKKIGGNGNTCSPFNGIKGHVYKDMNNDCQKNLNDLPLYNIPLKLYDNIGNLLIQTTSNIYGEYWFTQTPGNYSVTVDTAGVFVSSPCSYPGLDSIVQLTPSFTIAPNVDFAIDCPTGFDIGATSIVTSGLVFPGFSHNLHVMAGNINSWYNLNCPSNIPGTVKISVTGLANYVGPAAGALVPTTTLGNLFTYNIPNFSLVNPQQDFNLIFNIDTLAVAGNSICVSVTVTPTSDINPSNNIYQYCYDVTNSYDPNYKETYPEHVPPGYQDWLTYTIHFQNTGNASAIDIKLIDTLSNNLDLNTFSVINNSHPLITSLAGNKLLFKFNNINLPDSASNPAGSIGFVQYKIKPLPNLPGGTQIKNRAHIYFDFNAPIATNTSTNNFILTTGLNASKQSNQISVYPNPNSGNFVVETKEKITIELFDVFGKTILYQQISEGKTKIDISGYANGIYFLKTDKTNYLKIVKQ